MAYEPKPGDGSLFKNDKKTADNHPNATGYIIAHRDIKAGEKLQLAAWTKDGAKGKFQSLRMSDMRGQTGEKFGPGSSDDFEDAPF